MLMRENVLLGPLTTFQVGGPARYFAEARSIEAVREGIAFARRNGLPLFVLGGGSNLVVSDSGFPGLVLRIGIRGIERRSGTKIFDVGAYGQEVAHTIDSVQVLDTRDGQIRELCNEACAFTYRTSIFNRSEHGRLIVLRVDFSLKEGGQPYINYADLKRYFADRDESPTLAATREAVRQIRASKAMLIIPGDEDCRSAGSFFKNPVASAAEYESLHKRAQERGLEIPSYPALNAYRKVPAAWLVENSGFQKGYSRGVVGISRRHALAIVNRGGAKAADIIALKDEIQQCVEEKWGIKLQPEPVFVGFQT